MWDAWIDTRPCCAHAVVLTNRICRIWARTPRYAPRAAEMASSSSSVMPAGTGSMSAGVAAGWEGAATVRPDTPLPCSKNSMCLDISAICAWSCSSAAARSSTVATGIVSPSSKIDPIPRRPLPRSSGVFIIRCDVMNNLRLQRHQSVLFGRTQLPLGVQILEDLRHMVACRRGLDHRIHQTAAGGDIRIGEGIAVALDQLRAFGGLVFGLLDLFSENDIGRALRAHHRDLRGGQIGR